MPPIDASIALQGKPPVIPPFDVNATYRTLSQMKYLAAETQAAEQKARREQQTFQANVGGRRTIGAYLDTGELPGGTLSSIGRPQPQPMPRAPQPGTLPGGPPFDEATLSALPQGGSTPPVAGVPGVPPSTAPASRPGPSPNDPQWRAALYRLHPEAAEDLLKGLQAGELERLKVAQGQTKLALQSSNQVQDQSSLDAWLLANRANGLALKNAPTVYSPEAMDAFAQTAFTLGLSRCIGEMLYASPAVLATGVVVGPCGRAPLRR